MKNPVCYVNPSNPEEAVLERSVDGGIGFWGILGFGAVFTDVGFAMMASGYISRKNKVKNHQVVKLYDESTAEIPALLPVLNKPFYSAIIPPFIAAAGLYGWVFYISDSVDSVVDISGKVGWKYLFAIAPALIGIWIFVCAIRQALASFGPKMSVLMKPVLHPGETVALQWRMQGNPGNTQSLKIELVCEETLDRGKKNEDEKKTVRDILFIGEVPGPLTSDNGVMNLSLPLDVLLSAESDTEAVNWELHVKLRHAFLPKQKWEFKVIVAV